MSYAWSKPVALAAMFLWFMAFALPGFRAMTPWPDRDSFPISTFPMFSGSRPVEHRIVYLRGIKRDGSFIRVPHHHFAKGGMNAVLHQITKASRAKNKKRRDYCERAARKLVALPAYADVEKIAIVHAYFIPRKLFGDRIETPEREEHRVECALPHPGVDLKREGPAQKRPDQKRPDQKRPDQKRPDQKTPDQRSPVQEGVDQHSAPSQPGRLRREPPATRRDLVKPVGPLVPRRRPQLQLKSGRGAVVDDGTADRADAPPPGAP